MNNVPPDHERPDDADELYRRASALDTSRPSEAVRRAVLAHAARLAGARAAAPGRSAKALRVSWAYVARRPAAFGTLAAAVIAGLAILPTWRALAPRLEQRPAVADQNYEALTASPEAAVHAQPPAAATNPPPPPPPVFAEQVQQLGDVTTRAAPSRRAAPTPRPSAGLSNFAAAEPGAGTVAGSPAPRPAPAGKVTSITVVPTEAVAERDVAAQLREEQTAAASAQVRRSTDAKALEDVTVTGARLSHSRALKAEDPAEAFRRAAEQGDLVTLEALYAKQPSIDAQDAEGRTALMRAIRGGQQAAVSALLAYGANPNLADHRGTTPLAAAIAGGQAPIIDALRQHGAQ